MDYSALATSITEQADAMGTAADSIKSSPFDSIWKGSAHDTLITDLSDTLRKINDQKALVKKFASALRQIEIYKSNKEKITELYDRLNSLVDDDTNKKANALERIRIRNTIGTYRGRNTRLKSSINSALSGIKSVNQELSLVNYDLNDGEYKEYIVDIKELTERFKSSNLKTFGTSTNSTNFYDYYSNEEINYRLDQIKSQYTGRDAAVNCALGVMEMAAAVGGKLNLGWGMPGSSNGSEGIDSEYSSFASWAVNQGCNTDNITAATIVHSSASTTFEEARKGDVLVSESGSLVMIVDNDAENQELLVAEVSNPEDGVVVQAKSYASLTGNYHAKDLSSIYNE